MSTNLASDYSDGIPTLTRDEVDAEVDGFNRRWSKQGIGADWWAEGSGIHIRVSEDGEQLDWFDSLGDLWDFERKLNET